MQFEYSDGDNFKAYFKGRKSHWIHAVVQYNPLVRPSPIFFKCCRWTGVSKYTTSCLLFWKNRIYWVFCKTYQGRARGLSLDNGHIDDPSLGMGVVILLCSL